MYLITQAYKSNKPRELSHSATGLYYDSSWNLEAIVHVPMTIAVVYPDTPQLYSRGVSRYTTLVVQPVVYTSCINYN